MIKIKINKNKIELIDCQNKNDTKYKIDCYIEEELSKTKDKYDDYFIKNSFRKFHRSYDYFIYEKKNIKKKYNTLHVTNAWIKFQELVTLFKLIPDKISSKDNTFKYFDNAAFPGAFIFAMHHYILTKTNIKNLDWYGSSLLGDEDIALQDTYSLYKDYPKRWLMNKKFNGDVTDIKNINYWEKFFNNSVDLYTSDLGLAVSKDYNKQEDFQLRPNIGQLLTGIVVLKKGGSMITKQYTWFHAQNVTILALLTNLFKEVYVTKPITSRPFNSETYIVAKHYLGPFKKDTYEYSLIELIKDKIKKYDELPFIKKDCINKQFLSSLKEIYNKIFYRQIRVIEEELETFNKLENAKDYKDKKIIWKKINDKRNKVVKKWHQDVKLKALRETIF